MGKKRKAQEVKSKSTKMTAFNCPECKETSCVKVRMQKDKSCTHVTQTAICSCSRCDSNFPISQLSLLENDKSAYMKWVQYVRDKNTMGVPCTECRKEICVLKMTFKDGFLWGVLQCRKCRINILYDTKVNETVTELLERIKTGKNITYHIKELDGKPQKARRTTKATEQELSDEKQQRQNNNSNQSQSDETEENYSKSEHDVAKEASDDL